MSTVQENKLQKMRFYTAESAVREVLKGIFSTPQSPADRTLADFYRRHRNCGSRDRALINNCVFALLRYWGFIRELMPQTLRERVESGKPDLQSRDILAILYFALFTDNTPQETLKDLAETIGVQSVSCTSDDPRLRAEAASGIFGSPMSFVYTSLIPDFKYFVPQNWDYNGYCMRLGKRPPLWIRFASEEAAERVTSELRNAGYDFYRHTALSCAITTGKVNLQQLDTFRNGLFEVQDLASQVGS